MLFKVNQMACTEVKRYTHYQRTKLAGVRAAKTQYKNYQGIRQGGPSGDSLTDDTEILSLQSFNGKCCQSRVA